MLLKNPSSNCHCFIIKSALKICAIRNKNASCFNTFHAFPFFIFKVLVSTQSNSQLPVSSFLKLGLTGAYNLNYLFASQKYQDEEVLALLQEADLPEVTSTSSPSAVQVETAPAAPLNSATVVMSYVPHTLQVIKQLFGFTAGLQTFSLFHFYTTGWS